MTTSPPPNGGNGGNGIDGGDRVEELDELGARSGSRRLRVDIAIGALVLFGILVVVRLRGGDDPATPATRAGTGSNSSSPVARASAERPPVFPVATRQEGNLAKCPAGFECPVAKVASAGIKRALEAAFPGALIVSARTVRTVVQGYGQAIWAADVLARAGEQQIQLRLQPLSPADPEQHSVSLFNGHSITHWEGVLSQLRVVVDVVAPADRPASLAAVEQLAHDAQMLSPW
jgi:hypothetical protein